MEVRKTLYQIALREFAGYFEEVFEKPILTGTSLDCSKSDKCVHGAKCPYKWQSPGNWYSCFERAGAAKNKTQ